MIAKRSAALIAAILCVSAGPAAAQQSAPALDRLIADLASPEIARREEAMRILALDEALALRALEDRLRDPSLTLEQRCRLSQAARHRFMNSPRPAMGVQFDLNLPDRVSIDRTYKDFPAAQLLEPGDLIVSCEGEKLHRSRSAWTRLGAHIFAREPGDTISIVVRRGDQKIPMEIALGRYSDLNSGRPNQQRSDRPDDDRLERAWEVRCHGLVPVAARQPIDAHLPPTAWQQDLSPPDNQKLVRAKMQQPQQYRPRVVIGGEPRGGELDYDEVFQLNQQPNFRNNALINRALMQQRLAQQGLGPGLGNLPAVSQTVDQELSNLERMRVEVQRDLDLLSPPGAARPGDLAQRETVIQLKRDALARIKKQMDAIRAEAAEEQATAPVPPAPGR